MPTPLVSVIIPTFNRSGELRRSVESVIAQTYRPIQLIVVNDGSTDNTREVMDALETKVREAGVEPTFIHKENGGVSAARNTGIDAAKGEYIGFLDDDDEWLPTKLDKQIARIQETGADACCCRVLRITEDSEAPHPRYDKNLIEGYNPGAYVGGRSYAHIISLLVSAGKVRKSGPFKLELPFSEDVEWLCRLVHIATFCAVDELLARYFHTGDSNSRVCSGEAMLRRDDSAMRVLEFYREENRDHEAWDEEAWRARVGRSYEQFVKHRVYAGNLKRAAELYGKGVRMAGTCDELEKARRKLRKARWLRLIGKRMKHPKFGLFNDI